MTTDQKPWRAQVPPSYSVSGNVQWNRVFDERAVRSLVFKCNAELDAARARIAELESKLGTVNVQLGNELRRANAYNTRIAELEAACKRLMEQESM